MNVGVEAFNKTLKNALKKIFNLERDDWDHKIYVVLWDYRTTCKKMTSQTPFILVYGQEVIIPMEYIVPTLRITAITEMIDSSAIEERLSQLVQLEEDHFIAGYHQNVYKCNVPKN